MRKMFPLLILFFSVFFYSCVLEAVADSKVPPILTSEINKTEVLVGESIEITGKVTKAFNIKNPEETGYVVYLSDYPEEYEILNGVRYEKMTTEKYLCIKPEPYGTENRFGNIEGIIKVKLSFEMPGKYTLSLNLITDSFGTIEDSWGNGKNIYEIFVSEWKF
jgi:hypothetical protein